MEIRQYSDTEVLVEGGFDTKLFEIDEASLPIIFDILRNKMYANPIASICREITSNSRDANRESGNGNSPITISFVEEFLIEGAAKIVFTDNGTGLSPEAIDNIYRKYGSSTKRNTNNLTGGYGLGSKTPFAYTDTFYVDTIFDNVFYKYMVYIDTTGVGAVTLMHQEITTKGNGTSIEIPLRSESDFDLFKEYVEYYTTFWDVKPIIVGTKLFYNMSEEIKKFKTSDDIFTINQDARLLDGEKNYLIIDGIPYEIKTQLGFKGIVKFIGNGVVSLAATREELQYDEYTNNYLEVFKNEVVDVIKIEVESFFADDKITDFEKYKNFFIFSSTLGDRKNLFYQGLNRMDEEKYQIFLGLKAASVNLLRKSRYNESYSYDKYSVFGNAISLDIKDYNSDKYEVCLEFINPDRLVRSKILYNALQEKGKEFVALTVYNSITPEVTAKLKKVIDDYIGIELMNYAAKAKQIKEGSKQKHNYHELGFSAFKNGKKYVKTILVKKRVYELSDLEILNSIFVLHSGDWRKITKMSLKDEYKDTEFVYLKEEDGKDKVHQTFFAKFKIQRINSSGLAKFQKDPEFDVKQTYYEMLEAKDLWNKRTFFNKFVHVYPKVEYLFNKYQNELQADVIDYKIDHLSELYGNRFYLSRWESPKISKSIEDELRNKYEIFHLLKSGIYHMDEKQILILNKYIK